MQPRHIFNRSVRSVATAVAALFVGVLGTCAMLTAAYGMLADRQAQLESLTENLARLKAITELGQQASTASRSEDAAALARDFLVGSQDSIITADLQNRIRALTAANGVEFNSSSTQPPRTIDGITYLGLRVLVRGQVRDLQRVLHTVESESPLLFVSRINMRVDAWPMRSNDPNVNGAPALIAEIDLYGARLAGGRTAEAQPAPASAIVSNAQVPSRSGRGSGRAQRGPVDSSTSTGQAQ